jgi:hypothetical protein
VTDATITTYVIAMRDSRGRTLATEDCDDYGRAKRRYAHAVTTLNGGGFDSDIAEIALVRLSDRTQTTLRSTKPQTARAKAQMAMGVSD